MVALPTELRARWNRLSAEEQAEAELLLENRYGRSGLVEYINGHFAHEPVPKHVMPIVKLVERARHERIQVCLSLPPRHAKTVTLLRALGWWLESEPADTCAYYSYSDNQARSKSRLARRWAQYAGVQLSEDTGSVNEWRTRQGGGVIAGGLRSGLTGQGVSGLFIVDDPLKNREEADSRLIRDRVSEAFNEVVYTRLEGASVIAVHTRWHPDDLIGRLADSGWEVVNIPALAEEGDILGRAEGEALWPERFARDELLRIKRQIGDWSFAALYQGRPQPRGNAVFGEPGRYQMPRTSAEWRDFLQGKLVIIGADPAASEKTRADYSAAIVLVVDRVGPDCTAWVVDVVRGQWAVPAFVRQLRRLQEHWRCGIAVEAVAGFKSVPQMLRDVDPSLRIVELHPTTDKFQRSQPVAAAWNDGRVLVPAGEGAPVWVNPFLAELQVFTGVKDTNDDQVDSLAHGFNVISRPRDPRRRGHRVAHGPFG